MEFYFEVTINKGRDEVWKIFDNLENLKKWQPTLKRHAQVSGEPRQPGAVARLTYDENGREVVLEETITGRRKPEFFSGTYTGMGARNTLVNRFVAEGPNKTLWTVQATFEFSSLQYKLMAPAMKGLIRKRIEADLNRFKLLAERL